jgi:hypothetical protein
VFTLDQLDFISDYTMAWSLETNINSEQMRMFYNLQRIRYGLFELIGVKSVQRIDVVKVSL